MSNINSSLSLERWIENIRNQDNNHVSYREKIKAIKLARKNKNKWTKNSFCRKGRGHPASKHTPVIIKTQWIDNDKSRKIGVTKPTATMAERAIDILPWD